MAENDNNPPKKEATRLKLKLSDEVAKGVYANVTLVHNNENEFVFDFVYAEPQRPQGQVVSRVLTNPKTAKRLLGGLQEMIRRYEERFGEIPTPGNEQPQGRYH